MEIYKKIDTKILEILKTSGIEKLYPPQEEALIPALEKKNVVVSIPTASGKTLIAEITMISRLLEFRKKHILKKIVYLCPLKALASEKFVEFRKNWSMLGFKIAYSAGDNDTYDFGVFKNDIIVMTNEKADSMFRNRPELMREIGVVIVDEIHLINDNDRGVTLEILLTRIRTFNPTVQIIGLSATISNSDELAHWLDAVLIKSDWRPIDLKEGYFLSHQIEYSTDESKSLKYKTKDPIYDLVMDVLDDGGQCLVFLNTRRNSMKQAQTLSMQLKSRYNENEIRELTQLSEDFAQLSNPSDLTQDTKDLIRYIGHGVAFHHAGLTQEQRKFIEDNFRAGKLRVLTATPTLAAGVNTPARRVIIKSVYRYDVNAGGMAKIPVMEYKQMAGRAGRPGYDPYGDSILLSSNQNKTEELANYYIYGEPEWILSKLNNADLLQIHILGAIVMKKGTDEIDLIDFLSNTFLAYQIKYGTNDISSENRWRKKISSPMVRDQLNRISKRKQRESKAGKGRDPLNLPRLKDSFVSAAELHENNSENPIYKTTDAQTEPEQIISDKDLKDKLRQIIEDTLEFLLDYKFVTPSKLSRSAKPTKSQKIEESEEPKIFKPTKFGSATSVLYLKPQTAQNLFRRLKSLQKLEEKKTGKYKIDETTLLYTMSLTHEFLGIYSKASDSDLIYAQGKKYRKNLEMFTYNPEKENYKKYDEDEEEIDYFEENFSIYDDMTSLKQTFILTDWIHEVPESTITERYGIGSGDLRRMTETAQWLTRGLIKFTSLLKYESISKLTKDLNLRIRYGIGKELIPFVKLKGIGRVRARILYRSGILSIQQLAKTPNKEIEKLNLFSKNLVESIKNQLKLGKNIEPEFENNEENFVNTTSSKKGPTTSKKITKITAKKTKSSKKKSKNVKSEKKTVKKKSGSKKKQQTTLF